MKNRLKAKLQIRFVALSVSVLLILQAVILSVNAFYGYTDMSRKADMIINQLTKNPDSGIRHFSVSINTAAGEKTFFAAANESISREAAFKAAKTVSENGSAAGYCGDYRYKKFIKGNTVTFIFLWRATSIELYKSNTKGLAVISGCGILVTAVILGLLSGSVVRPITRNHKKQKQFITYAGHELKTPLTVIGADAQLLESEIGENEWLSDIKAQVKNLTQMTESLVALAKSQELDENPQMRDFSLSAAAAEAADSYRAAAAAAGLSFKADIAENVTLCGDEAAIRRLISVLLDNAHKYCAAGGGISFSVTGGERTAAIAVKNSVNAVDEKQLKSFTDRFFRGSNAQQKPGFGLGLAIAEAITQQHKGNLEIKLCNGNEILITCTLHR